MFVTPPNTIRIRTASFAFASVPGSGTAGATDSHLFTPDGEPNYVTFLTPLGVGQINATTLQVMAQAGDVPHEGQYPFAVPGAIRKGEGTKTFFGQEYDRAVIEALGVLLIRANLLDHGLIETYCAMTGVSIQQASNQYYSSTNMKARLDVIRSLADVSSLSGERKEKLLKALDIVSSVSNRRNDLVHAHWYFRDGKHITHNYKPNSKNKILEVNVTAKAILSLAEDYLAAQGLLPASAQLIERERKATSNTATSRSSGDPSI